MGPRFALLAATAFGILHAQAPPPMFSPWYSEALRDTLKLEPSDAAQLERALAANPEDQTARLKLMAYHLRGDRATRSEDRAQRAALAVWLIEHHPDSEILHSPFARFAPGEVSAEALWDRAVRQHPTAAADRPPGHRRRRPGEGLGHLVFFQWQVAAAAGVG